MATRSAIWAASSARHDQRQRGVDASRRPRKRRRDACFERSAGVREARRERCSTSSSPAACSAVAGLNRHYRDVPDWSGPDPASRGRGAARPRRRARIDFGAAVVVSRPWSGAQAPRQDLSDAAQRFENDEQIARRPQRRRDGLAAPSAPAPPPAGSRGACPQGRIGGEPPAKGSFSCQASRSRWRAPLATSAARCSPFSPSGAFLFPRSSPSRRRARSARRSRSATACSSARRSRTTISRRPTSA